MFLQAGNRSGIRRLLSVRALLVQILTPAELLQAGKESGIRKAGRTL